MARTDLTHGGVVAVEHLARLGHVVEYEAALEPHLTGSAPPPGAGFGTVETAFVRINGDLAHGAVSRDDAVEQFFSEAEAALAAGG